MCNLSVLGRLITKQPSLTPAEVLSLRLAADLTQEQAATRVFSPSYRTWQNWEKGTRQMPVTALELWKAQDKIRDLERRLERAEHPQDR